MLLYGPEYSLTCREHACGKEEDDLREHHVAVQVKELALAAGLAQHALQPGGGHVFRKRPAQILDAGGLPVVGRVPLVEQDGVDPARRSQHALADAHGVPVLAWHFF